MEDKYYACKVFHKRKNLKMAFEEKLVLYSNDNIHYIDLVNNKCYTTDINEKEYVIEDSIMPIDISEYNIDYRYLLVKRKENK